MQKIKWLLLVSLFPLPVFAVTPLLPVFEKDLRLGSSGSDVLLLQQILNQRAETTISLSGPGSKGQETQYFGTATRKAVIIFQNLHADEVLYPVGLTSGTGFVGKLTRAKLKTLANPSVFSNNSTNSSGIGSNTVSAESETKEKPRLDGISAYSGAQGSTLTLTGAGFVRNANVLSFGSAYQLSVDSPSNTSLSFVIPENAPLGKHYFSISNKNGMSTSSIFFVVTKPGVAAPKISSVTPSKAEYGSVVTLSGSGFASTNTISGSSQIFSAPSSDGKTISFTLQSPEFAKLVQLKKTGKIQNQIDIPLAFYIINENGVTVDPAKFILQIK